MGKQYRAGAESIIIDCGVRSPSKGRQRWVEMGAIGLSLGLLLSACDSGPETTTSMSEGETPAAVSESVPDRPAPVFEATLTAPKSVTLSRNTAMFDGQENDLISAGLGLEGLRASAPTASSPPSASDIRRLAIYQAYRGLMDLRPGGSLEQFKRADGQAALAPIAGIEVLAMRQLGDMHQSSAVLLQIPDHFNWDKPCLVASATSGSRGIYGAIPVIAHWALPRQCAVVYTEKGAGNGISLASQEMGYRPSGQLISIFQAAFDPLVDEEISEAKWEVYTEENPHRIAFRHAHSADNPEAAWGEFLIDAVYFALDELNVRRPAEAGPITHMNTQVIATGISNGGGAALAAMEMDDLGLFDGVAVAEPNVNVPGSPALIDSSTLANLYAACAVQALEPTSHPLAALLSVQAGLFKQRCEHLAKEGLLDAEQGDLPQQALSKMHEIGYPASADPLLAFAVSYELYPAIAATYVHSLGQFRFYEPPCEVAFAYTNSAGEAMPLPQDKAGLLFAMSSGIAPTADIQLVRKDASGVDRRASTVPSYGDAPDGDLAAALCHRDLVVGSGSKAASVQAGVEATLRNGNLRGRPAYIVHGAADNVVPIAHSSDAYNRLNTMVEGQHSRLEYVRVEKGQHFDALMALPMYQDQYEPLHPHFVAALDRLWDVLNPDQG